MAPKRSQKPDDTDDNDNYDSPSWDANDRNLMLYLIKMRRWLPKQHKQFNNFVRFGYIINNRQEVMCFTDSHKEALKRGFNAGTFEKPCMAGLEEAEDSEGDSSVDSASLTHPPSARKGKPDKTTTTPMDTPGLAEAEDEQFKIAPKREGPLLVRRGGAGLHPLNV